MFEAQAYPAKVNVHGAIGSREKNCLVIMAGNMDSEGYIYDLENALIPNAHRIYGARRWLLKQDNAPYHTSSFFRFYCGQCIAFLLFPYRSPDLSPIENIWGLIKRKIVQIQINCSR